ncbi:MAG: GNAT family N-acetyltransferase [Defluviitaleaceae bacterium]|nr:GNAT family N-acetyltransferase [Defluviitaleaceae bacterium]
MKKSPFDKFPHIETDEILLRKITVADVDALFEIYNNKRLFEYTPSGLKDTKEAVAELIERFGGQFEDRQMIRMAITLKIEGDFPVGVFEIYGYNADVNMVAIGYRVNERYWGKRVATKSVNAVVRFLFDLIGINRIYAEAVPTNLASLSVLENCGFIREGIARQGFYFHDRGVVDGVIYSVLRSDYHKDDSI